MPTELKQLFLKKGDEELAHIYFNQGEYTAEAIEAMKEILDEKGGMEKWLKERESAALKNNEIIQLRQYVHGCLASGREPDMSVYKIQSLEGSEIKEIISQERKRSEIIKKDEEVSFRVIGKGLLGGVIATIVFIPLVWFTALRIFSEGVKLYIYFLLLAGLFLGCLGIVKAFTKKSANNIAVI
jgi:VIT1/CCC1 family predicted Fe2+/Mn2+ transporter